jgi:glutamate dehydrogenase
MAGKKSAGASKLKVAQVRELVFSEAAAEDVEGLSKADLEWIAGQAIDFLDNRKPGRLSIRLENPELSAGLLAHRSVLEVLNDDMPFLVDSVVNALSKAGHDVYTVLHPVFMVTRSRTGKLEALLEKGAIAEGASRESYIHIQLERIVDVSAQRKLLGELESILAEVRAAVVDWQPMRQAVQQRIDALRSSQSPLPTAVVSESIDFLSWLLNNRFTFLGMSHYVASGKGSARKMKPLESSALGILRLQPRSLFRNASRRDIERYQTDRAILIEKSDLLSRIHRSCGDGLCRCLRLRRGGPDSWRVAHSRPLHFGGIYRIRSQHSHPEAQDRDGYGAKRVFAVRPFGQGAGERARDNVAGRPVPDRCG